MAPSTLDLALAYLKRNPTRYLFPIRRGSKTPPLIENNLQAASNDAAQITRWHKLHPGCNWGLAHAKSKIFLADIDTKPGKFGEATFDTLNLLYGWAPTETNITPSGGRHYLYAGEHIFALGKYGFGIDVDSPNYSLIPGCTLNAGGAYEEAFNSAPIAPAPQWFYDLFASNKPEAGATVDQEASIVLDLDENVEWAKQWLLDPNGAPPSIEGQNGEKTVLDIAGVLKDHGISLECAIGLMDEFYNHPGKCDPLWRVGDGPVADRLDVKIANAYSYLRQTRPGEKSARGDFQGKDNNFFTEAEDAADKEALDRLKAKDAERDAASNAKAQAKDDKKKKKAADKEATADHAAIKGIGNDWVYITQLHRFVCRSNFSKVWKAEQFNARFAHVPRGKWNTMSEKLLETPGAVRKFDEACYRPGKPEFDGDAYNFYRASDIVPVEGDTRLWDQHLAYLFQDPSYANHVLNWMAWILQNMGLKPKHALLVAGFEKGTGKSFLAEVFARLIGKRNVSPVRTPELTSSFNSYAVKSKLLVVEEMDALDKRKAKDTLHSIITQEDIPINEKGIPGYNIENCFGIMAMTNTDAAIPLEQGDRRYLVVRTFAQPREAEYYERLYTVLGDKDALAAIMYQLMNRDVGKYKGSQRAPETEAKDEMTADAATELEFWMRDNAETPPLNGRVLRIDDVISALPKRLDHAPRLAQNVGSILRHRFRGVKHPATRLPGGGRGHLWEINGGVLRDTADWDGSLARAYERARAAWASNKPEADAKTGDFANEE